MSDGAATPTGPGVLRYNLTTLARDVVETAVARAHPLVIRRNSDNRQQIRDAANTALDELPSTSEADWETLILSTIENAPELEAARSVIHLARATNEAAFWEHMRGAWRTMIEGVYALSRW